MAGFLTFLLGLVYAIILIWIIRRYSIKHIPGGSYIKGEKRTYRLANVLRIIISVVLVSSVFTAIIWPFAFYVYPAIRHLFDPSFLTDKIMSFDINTFFRLDLKMQSALKITGLEDQTLRGKVSMGIIPQKIIFWHIYQLLDWLKNLILCYILLEFHNIFTSICNGDAFTGVITGSLKKMGIIIIIWNSLSPFVQYYGYGAVLKNITVSTEALKITPYFYVGIEYLFLGVALLVLAGIINEAVKMHEEQRLTI
ncbi:MAG: DUF2975 domain-containing protein [Desulfatiglans sp.]|jgi:hypothetical protein|nr:DUF2975 domain-containing protein [Desulfatiglans sp.]